MKKVFLIFGLFFTLGLTGLTAQDYVGTYSGTLTFIPTKFPLDESLINLQIENQALQVSENGLYFSEIPVLKEGDPFDIGFPSAEFSADGDISAPAIEGSFSGIPIIFTITSGKVSGNTINLTFRMVDKTTNGTIVDVTANYTGTNQGNVGINDIPATTEKKIVGYYSITGQQLNEEPQSGFYIVVYDNGKSEKIMKR